MSDVQDFQLTAGAVAPLKQALPAVAAQTVEAITDGVPAYAKAFSGPLGPQIEKAVRAALGTFLNLVSRPAGRGQGSPLAPALEAAYALGRGEARNGRSLDALLAAYRLGARVAWRELAAISVRGGQDSGTIAHFAEQVFAYIDELSAASVAGHADELATSNRARRRHLEHLAQVLLAGEPEHVVLAAAERAEWASPQTLTALLVPEPATRAVLELLDARTLQAAEAGPDETSVLLVPDAQGVSRAHLMRLLAGRGAIVGPSRPWLQVRESLARAVRTARFAPSAGGAVVDTEEHLVSLVVNADPQALADLREKALAPLAGERSATAEKLAETLRGWLLHHGRRDEVAAALFVHPQTVRYRMTRVRELYGDRLRDPQWLLLLTVALA
ncbi:PucR family transcriptional regulator [Actinoplanes friuliensis]|uniref:PucR family transcriptional regulator n=1 Tax=Actinoplanes friuliensis TaxID=196914 RepID=UPI0005A135C5|nr:PucR family transcriptional regulator [Actinoplanes friuliensis]